MATQSHPRFNRNNTNFPLQLEKFFHEIDWDPKYDFLKYYQNIARIYAASDTGTKGLLVYHTMGMGKSILAVSVAVDMLGERQPIILLTKSLQDNMRGAVRKYIKMRSELDPDFMNDIVAYFSAKNQQVSGNDVPNTTAAIEYWIDKKFSFVSLNASNMMTQLYEKIRPDPARKTKRRWAKNSGEQDVVADPEEAAVEDSITKILNIPTLEGKLLIVDEAQNLFRMITNGSKNGIELYNLILKTKNLKCLFFSGTPISSNPFELAICFNMLAGQDLFPPVYYDFVDLYMEPNGLLKNKPYFQNRIMGLVSHVSDKTIFHLKPDAPSVKNHKLNTTKVEFPEVFPTKLVYVPMHGEQFALYNLAREKEIEEEERVYTKSTIVSLMKPKSEVSTSFRVRSRKLSNFYYRSKHVGQDYDPRPLNTLPDEAFDVPKINEAMKIIDNNRGKLGLLYSQFVGDGGLAPIIERLRRDGWEQYKPSQKTGSGPDESAVERLQRIMLMDRRVSDPVPERLDLSSIIGGADAKQNRPRRFAVITGEVPVDERDQIMKAMTRYENRYGTSSAPDGVDLLLISSTGSLGLDLKNIRYVVIMEPFWLYTLIKQIEARAARNDSHKDLPPEERNVQTYILLAVPPNMKNIKAPDVQDEGPPAPLLPSPAVLDDEHITTDVDIYNKSLMSYESIRSFEDALKEVCIECSLTKSTCRICSPTNQALFTRDPKADVSEPDPCRPPQRGEKMKSFVRDGKKYFYKENPESIFGYELYARDESMGIYKRLDEASPEFRNAIVELGPPMEDVF